MDKYTAAERVLEIKEQIQELVEEARNLVREYAFKQRGNLDAYVFEQILEHCDKGNSYNQDLNDVANIIERGEDNFND